MRKYSLIILLIACSFRLHAWEIWPLPFDAEIDIQRDTLHYGLSTDAVIGNAFWLNANTAGDVPQTKYSGILSLYAYKPAARLHRWWDYSFGIQINGRAQSTGAYSDLIINTTDKHVTAYFQQLYAHFRLYILDFTAGIKPLSTTYGNKALSMGSLLFSDNAHPMPRLTVGIDKWTPFPLTFGFVEIRGGITHIWATTYPKQPSWAEPTSSYFIHHKFIGGRIGGELPLRISYEFHHAAQWGGISPVYGDLGNNIKTFGNIFLGKSGGSSAVESNNMQGNHLCMQQLAFDLNLDILRISTYWQVLQEDGPIRFMGTTMNKKDGLWGVSISQYYWPNVFQTITYEFLNTTDQSGPLHDIDGFIFGGRDDYYSHAIYRQGWTYLGRTIGNPLLTPYNNRVKAHHVGILGNIFTYQYRFLFTHTRYFQPYSEDLSFNKSKEIAYRQTSIMLEVKKKIPQAYGITISAAIAADFYPEHKANVGGRITICKTFDFQY